MFLGTNPEPNAVELVFQALGFCCAAGYIANAAWYVQKISPVRDVLANATSVRTSLEVA